MATSTSLQQLLDAIAAELTSLALPAALLPAADAPEGLPTALWVSDTPGLAYELVEPQHLSVALWADAQDWVGRGQPGHILLQTQIRLQVTVCWTSAPGEGGSMSALYALAQLVRDALILLRIDGHTPGPAISGLRWTLRRHPTPVEDGGEPYLLDVTAQVRHQEG